MRCVKILLTMTSTHIENPLGLFASEAWTCIWVIFSCNHAHTLTFLVINPQVSTCRASWLTLLCSLAEKMAPLIVARRNFECDQSVSFFFVRAVWKFVEWTYGVCVWNLWKMNNTWVIRTHFGHRSLQSNQTPVLSSEMFWASLFKHMMTMTTRTLIRRIWIWQE